MGQCPPPAQRGRAPKTQRRRRRFIITSTATADRAIINGINTKARFKKSGIRLALASNTARTGFGSSTPATSRATSFRQNFFCTLPGTLRVGRMKIWMNTPGFGRNANSARNTQQLKLPTSFPTYTKFNGRRKPELLDADTYSLVNYGEFEKVVADYEALAAKAEKISAAIATGKPRRVLPGLWFVPDQGLCATERALSRRGEECALCKTGVAPVRTILPRKPARCSRPRPI